MGIASGSRLADSIRRLSERIGIPRSFRGFGLAESHLPGIIKQCRSGSMRSNPREMSDADVTALMRSLM
jgi:alcohol dehydrogenase class IV